MSRALPYPSMIQLDRLLDPALLHCAVPATFHRSRFIMPHWALPWSLLLYQNEHWSPMFTPLGKFGQHVYICVESSSIGVSPAPPPAIPQIAVALAWTLAEEPNPKRGAKN